MNHSRLLCAVLLLALSSVATASSFYTTSEAVTGALKGTSNGTSATSGSFSDNKIVLAARDDAASYVASDGAIRGVYLEAAIVLLRTELPEVQAASDLDLARAILAL
ncbi:MAG: DUF2388 domain-containing protein [Lysobacter sp.]